MGEREWPGTGGGGGKGKGVESSLFQRWAKSTDAVTIEFHNFYDEVEHEGIKFQGLKFQKKSLLAHDKSTTGTNAIKQGTAAGLLRMNSSPITFCQ